MITTLAPLTTRLLNQHSICFCYATQIDYTIKNYNYVYACHCFECLRDNNNAGYSANQSENINNVPIIWVNAKKYIVHNKKLRWKRSSIIAKRGYCPCCNDILVIDYYFRKYVKDMSKIPKADLFCSNKARQVSAKSYSSLFYLFLSQLFHTKI